MSQPLAPLDATFLELEDADRSAHMHIGAILVFEGPAPGLDELRARLERERSCIAVNADRDLVRDIDELISGIETDVAALDAYQTSV